MAALRRRGARAAERRDGWIAAGAARAGAAADGPSGSAPTSQQAPRRAPLPEPQRRLRPGPARWSPRRRPPRRGECGRASGGPGGRGRGSAELPRLRGASREADGRWRGPAGSAVLCAASLGRRQGRARAGREAIGALSRGGLQAGRAGARGPRNGGAVRDCALAFVRSQPHRVWKGRTNGQD